MVHKYVDVPDLRPFCIPPYDRYRVMVLVPYAVLSLALVSPVCGFSTEAAQVPWDVGAYETNWSEGNRAWNTPPDSDSTSQFIFTTVDSLLQRFPNTLNRNGMSHRQ